MNRFGKILIVSILAMSILFMASSVAIYYTHKNWKAVILRPQADVKPGEPLGLKEQLAEANKRVTTLKEQFEKLQKTVQTEDLDQRGRMGKLEVERAELNKVYVEMVAEVTALKQAERTAVEAAQVAQENLDGKLNEIDDLNAQIVQTHNDRDAAFKEAVALTDQVNEKEVELMRASASTQTLKRQVAQSDDVAKSQAVAR
jgi:chromosome segregation ATPase